MLRSHYTHSHQDCDLFQINHADKKKKSHFGILMILIAIEYSFKQEFVLTQGGEPGTRTQGNCSGCPERFNGRVLHYKFADSTKVSISAILASKNVKFPSRRSYRYSTGVHEFIYKFYSTYRTVYAACTVASNRSIQRHVNGRAARCTSYSTGTVQPLKNTTPIDRKFCV